MCSLEHDQTIIPREQRRLDFIKVYGREPIDDLELDTFIRYIEFTKRGRMGSNF